MFLGCHVGPPYPGRDADEAGEFEYAVCGAARVATLDQQPAIVRYRKGELFPSAVGYAFDDNVGFGAVAYLHCCAEKLLIVVAEHVQGALSDRWGSFIDVNGEWASFGSECE